MRKSTRNKKPGAFFFAGIPEEGTRAADQEQKTMEENKNIKIELPENLLLDETKKDPEGPEQKAAVIPEELPRLPDGKIDVEKIATGKDAKGYIIPDIIFDKYLKDLPEGTTNESGSFRAYNGGKLARLENNREEASKRGLAGAISSNTTQAARRTFAEIGQVLLSNPARLEEIEDYNLPEGTDDKTIIVARAIADAKKGDDKARQWLTGQIGEQAATKSDVTLSGLTPEDKQLLENVSSRIGQNHNI